MGMIGRYIDALPDDALDRVIAGQEWVVEQEATRSGARCLIGHASDAKIAFDGDRSRATYGSPHLSLFLVGVAFDVLAKRVGLDRAVALVKARAGKRTRVDVSQPAPAPSRKALVAVLVAVVTLGACSSPVAPEPIDLSDYSIGWPSAPSQDGILILAGGAAPQP